VLPVVNVGMIEIQILPHRLIAAIAVYLGINIP
jgi:hypothetical protein